jgi:hypothetical protein
VGRIASGLLNAPAWEGGRYKGERRAEGGVKPPLQEEPRALVVGRNCDKEIGLAGDLLGFELAVEGFEDPVLEDFAVAGLYFAEDETEAGWPGVEDYRFGFEGFSGFANFQIHVALFVEGSRGFEETALQAQFGRPCGEHRFRRGFGSDLGIRVEGKS